MASGHIAVCCKLPHGLILRHPVDETKTVELKGKNKSVIIGGQYGTTMVPVDFWEQWEAANKEFPAVVSGAIFTAKNSADAEAMAKEFKDRKTGLEPLEPKAHGVVPADKD